jgi:cell division protein FtsB
MKPLQILIPKLNDVMLQYGILGVLSLFLGYFAWHTYQSVSKKNDEEYKRMVTRNEKLESDVEKLRTEMMHVIVEERDRMASLVSANTNALVELRKTIVDYLLEH